MSKAFLMVCLFAVGFAIESDYSLIETCDNLSYSLDLRKVFILHKPDTIIIEVLFPICLVASICVIAAYCTIKAVRQQPGDILLALSISSLFLLTSYFATVMYNLEHPIDGPVPQSFKSFCMFTGYFYTLSFCCNVIYNVVFCMYFIIQLKHALKEYRRKWIVHLISLIVLAVVGLIFYLTDCIGISLFGVCGFKISAVAIFVETGLILLYLLIVIISLVYFRKYVPKMSVAEHDWRLFIKYYFRYIIIISVSAIVRCISDLIAAINCLRSTPHEDLQAFITVSNVFNLLTPAIVFIVVTTHPEVKSSIRRLAIRLFGENKKREEELEETGRQMIEMTCNTELLYKIMEQKKCSLVYTILAAIYLEDGQIDSYHSLKQVSDWNYDDKLEMMLDENSMLDYEEIRVPGMSVMKVQIRSYAPKVFKTLMKLDGLSGLQDHVNPALNEQQIKKLVQSDGGKSGQFFFFTFDNKVILKTLTSKQQTVIMSRLKHYVDHCIENPYSLITKISGIYTIIDLESQQEYTVYAMRNLAGCDRKYINRIYDLKGSKFDRQVIKDYSKVEVGHINKTMKDQDFDRIQKKIHGTPEQIEQIKSILTEDSMFFRVQRLIDYSLIIIRINIESLLRDQGMTRDSFMRTVANPYSIIFNEQNDNAYVIGIIDYLETWNANKKGEKFLKSLFFKTKSQEISAQSPEIYSERFVKELVYKIF